MSKVVGPLLGVLVPLFAFACEAGEGGHYILPVWVNVAMGVMLVLIGILVARVIILTQRLKELQGK